MKFFLFLGASYACVFKRLVCELGRKFFVLFVVLQQLGRNRRKDPHLGCILFGLFQLAQDILEHLRFAMIFFFNLFEYFNCLFGNNKRLVPIKLIFPAFFLEIAPLGLNTFLKFLGCPDDIHSNIVLPAIGNHQSKLIFYFNGILIFLVLESLDDS